MKHAYSILAFLAVTVLAAPAGLADVPDFVTYSGRLTDGTAWGQSTTLDLTFRVYGSADDKNDLLWEKEYPGLAVEDGYFSVLLGDGDNPGTPEVEADYNVTVVFAANDEIWITVCVGDDCALPGGDLAPRQQVGSVPYAVRAGNSANLAGHEEAYYATADTVDALDDKLTGSYYTVQQLGEGQLDDRYVNRGAGGDSMLGPLALPGGGLSVGTNQLVVSPGGALGIGTAQPSSKLDVVGQAEIHGPLFGYINSTSIDYLSEEFPVGITLKNTAGDNDDKVFNGLSFETNEGDAVARILCRMNKNTGYAATYGDLRFLTKNAGQGKTLAERMVITSAGNVGIGTKQPIDNLHLKTSAVCSGSAVMRIEAETPGDGCPSYARIVLVGSDWGTPGSATIGREYDGLLSLFNGPGNVPGLAISKNANVGVGTKALEEVHRLTVNGSIKASGGVCSCSDKRIKRNVRPIHDALAQVLALTGVSFEFDNSDYPDLDLPEGRQVGLVAQDVEEVVPEVVMSPPDGGLKSIKYANLVALLIEAVKEQQGQLDDLRAENEELHARLDRLEALVMASGGRLSQPSQASGGLR